MDEVQCNVKYELNCLQHVQMKSVPLVLIFRVYDSKNFYSQLYV